MNVPKEAKEVVDFLAHVLGDIIAKKGVAEIAAGNLPALMTAVDGFSQLGDEVKSDARGALAAYLVKEMLDKLAPVAPAAPVA